MKIEIIEREDAKRLRTKLREKIKEKLQKKEYYGNSLCHLLPLRFSGFLSGFTAFVEEKLVQQVCQWACSPLV